MFGTSAFSARTEFSVTTTVKAVLKKFGGSIWIAAASLVGSFLAIAFVGIGGVYILSR
jgi:hypothetical protein